ncbi:hypothetical protein MMC17_001830 [Xylographa soralifera]|nr:hypothetical protein [Xylographa soralifera]
MTQLDVLLKRIKNDHNALLNTNFGDILNAQDEKILMKKDILLVMLRKVEDSVLRANKVKQLDSAGTTLLYWAIDQNDEYLVGLLLESGADPDIKITSKKVLTVWENDLETWNSVRRENRRKFTVYKRITTWFHSLDFSE